jgi:hypothetical protein
MSEDKNFIERRNYPCQFHAAFEEAQKNFKESLDAGDLKFDSIDFKIDTIMQRQLDHLDAHALIASDVQRIKSTVENGLKSKVSETAEAVGHLKAQIADLETFTWFRKMVTGFRDNLFKNILKFGFAASIIYAFFWLLNTLGKETATSLIKSIVK